MMLLKSADSISDFRIVSDGGYRRVSVFGMGWTGYTLPKYTNSDVFENDDKEEIPTGLDVPNDIANQIVFDDDLKRLAHYFYNLGRQHGLEAAQAGIKNI